ncbi:I78 family peptidase inhibitor [Xanthomonas theicola]|uniref:Peptidase inhibitor I78 family protein n=1 Tax=Xanthomonas theicola TaxID=56464 RepID=A0A2S6ZM13_9XANT|nr:I78 family peptidase inhibitor [Xanthomonas theicola]PPT93219.1 hypothetical protein XthCFBP4691_00985 [Xanthomonas theicola]QNH24845.1 hypothetical protein G4Q83_08915 [Xanthomonas theicola]
MSRAQGCIAALLPLLAACTPPASLQPASGGPDLQGDGRCLAAPVAWAVGQPATEATMARVREQSGAGQAATRGLRPDRLNVFLDTANAIVRIDCG